VLFFIWKNIVQYICFHVEIVIHIAQLVPEKRIWSDKAERVLLFDVGGLFEQNGEVELMFDFGANLLLKHKVQGCILGVPING